ncbi:hypothetical protein ABZP36_029505 [Zizania latifolia]
MVIFPTGVAAHLLIPLYHWKLKLPNQIFHGPTAPPDEFGVGRAKAARSCDFHRPVIGCSTEHRVSWERDHTEIVGEEFSSRSSRAFSVAAAVESASRPDDPEGITAALSPNWIPLGENGLACAITSAKESKYQKRGSVSTRHALPSTTVITDKDCTTWIYAY